MPTEPFKTPSNADDDEEGLVESILKEIRLRGDSGCRQKYCRECEDVLWDGERGVRHDHCGVMALLVDFLHGFEYHHYTTDSPIPRIYKLKCRHDPLTCLYPHVEIDLIEDGETATPSRVKNMNKVAKSKIKDAIVQNCRVLRSPSAS